MRLENILANRKSTVVSRWFEAVTRTYQPDTSRFLSVNKNEFSNPVGQTIRKGLDAVYDELLQGLDRKTVISFLDPIVRIRAVQSFTPTESVGFIFQLKKIIREELGDLIRKEDRWDELSQFEDKVDLLGLIAFDIYMECREKIFSLRTNEERQRIYSAFNRAGLVSDEPEADPDLDESN